MSRLEFHRDAAKIETQEPRALAKIGELRRKNATHRLGPGRARGALQT